MIMTEQEQRIAIAQACGWKCTNYQSASPQIRADVPFWTDGERFCQAEHLPDYLHDLSAMHEAEKLIDAKDPDTRSLWLDHLTLAMNWPKAKNAAELRFGLHYLCARATAAQRAEAFLRTIGKWVE